MYQQRQLADARGDLHSADCTQSQDAGVSRRLAGESVSVNVSNI